MTTVLGTRSIGAAARAVRFECNSFASQDRFLYRITVLRNVLKAGDDSALVGRGTELVMDGLQRSANSFAAAAFLSSQHRPVRLAHHLHSSEQLVRAVESGKPVVLLIREPSSCVLGIVGQWQYISVRQALRSYIRYYSRAAPVADRCVIGYFDEVISDLGRIIQSVNDRYNVQFDLFEASDEAQRRLYDPEDPSRLSRKDYSKTVAWQLEEPENAKLLVRADALWEQYQRYR